MGKIFNATRLFLQGFLFLRLVAGAFLTVFTRPSFSPSCVAIRQITIIPAVVLGADAVIVGALVVLATLTAIHRDKNRNLRYSAFQSRAFFCGIGGLATWTLASIPMILGLLSYDLALKTILPAYGLLIVITIVALFPGLPVISRRKIQPRLEASSPFMTPMPPSQEISNSNFGTGSPASRYMRGGDLYVVNPSNTSVDTTNPLWSNRGNNNVSDAMQKNISGNDTWNENSKYYITPINQDRKLSENNFRPKTANQTPSYRGSSGIFPSQVYNQAAMAPVIMLDTVPTLKVSTSPIKDTSTTRKRSIFNWQSKNNPRKQSIRNLSISKPLVSGDNDSLQSFSNIPTIDLHEAVDNDRKRREALSIKSNYVASRSAPKPPFVPATEVLYPHPSLEEKQTNTKDLKKKLDTGFDFDLDEKEEMPEIPAHEIATFYEINYGYGNKDATPPTYNESAKFDDSNKTGSTTSVLYSHPGGDEIRRRSPKKNGNLGVNTARSLVPNNQNFLLPSPGGNISPGTKDSERVMFVNEIIYDNPAIVNDIMEQVVRVKYQHSNINSPLPSNATNLSSTSIIHRPRPISRKSVGLRENTRRSKSVNHPHPKASPTSPPPVPPLPTRAANLKHLLQADTENLTYEERIKYLFPAPPKFPNERKSFKTHRRHSSLPSLGNVSAFYDNKNSFSSPKDLEYSPPTLFNPDGDFNIKNKMLTQTIMTSPRKLQKASIIVSPANRDLSSRDKFSDGLKSTEYEQSQALFISEDDDDSQGILTVMLDSEDVNQNESLSTLDLEKNQRKTSWHHRIGESIPTFSEKRLSVSNTRKKAPPPLLSNWGVKDLPFSGSKPFSPNNLQEHALAQIQAQLLRFETQKRGSTSSLLEHMPVNDQPPDRGEAILLENLEEEIEAQSNLWMQMQSNIDRNVNSMILTPIEDEDFRYSQPSTVKRSTLTKSFAADQSEFEESRGSKYLSISTIATTKIWQRKLAEVQNSYNSLFRQIQRSTKNDPNEEMFCGPQTNLTGKSENYMNETIYLTWNSIPRDTKKPAAGVKVLLTAFQMGELCFVKTPYEPHMASG
ncbi:hypothetical protein K3495_g9355 [Podosphaera aphanis]|nr:hypothetical protein K3495_g9355 [Podosphaera aphanis]